MPTEEVRRRDVAGPVEPGGPDWKVLPGAVCRRFDVPEGAAAAAAFASPKAPRSGARRERAVTRASVGFALLVAASAFAAPAQPQAPPPDEDWRQLRTTHFDVTYPASMDALAGKAAAVAERAHATLSDRFASAPAGRIQLLLSDHADISNGYASPSPYNRITVFARPPMGGGSISYFDDWLELVITHELVHTFHFEMAGTLGKVARRVFGRAPFGWPFFPSAAAPTWVAEGLATYYESEIAGAGRVHGTWQEMVLRAAALEDALSPVDQASGDSPAWPGGNRPYVYGARFLEYMAERHGEAALGEMARSVADQWTPFRLGAAARSAFGTPLSQSWDEWRGAVAEGQRDVAGRAARRAPVTEGEVVEDGGRHARQAVASPDGAFVAYLADDGVADPRVVVARPDGSGARALRRVNSVGGSLSWHPGGGLVFADIEFAGPHRVYSDLYRVGMDGRAERLTRNLRLTYADVSPNGRSAVAVQEGEGTNRLVKVDLGTGAVTELAAPNPGRHWAYPRWSPDGTRIAASRWTAPGMMDVVVLEADGSLAVQVTEDRAVDTTPFWMPDGSGLVWSSDRTGIPNVFVALLPDAPAGRTVVRQATNVLGGAAHPSVDPSGRWLYYSSHGAAGWSIRRIPFSPGDWTDPQPPSPRFAEAPRQPAPLQPAVAEPLPGAADPSGESQSDPRPAALESRRYSSLGTLRPRYWLPQLRRAQTALDRSGERHDVVRTSLGFWTEGRDLVGRHAFVATGELSLDRRFAGAFSYEYGGFGNPVVGLSASQDYDARSRALAARAADGSVAEFLLAARERRAMLTASLARRRVRSAAALTARAGFVRSDFMLLDLDGARTDRASLVRPRRTYAEAGAGLWASNARRHPFSISREDGVSASVSGRVRRDLYAPLTGVAGQDGSYNEALARVDAYKSLALPGFSRHVLGVRASAGHAWGPGADQYHFDVGGAGGASQSIAGYRLPGSRLLFPARGYAEGSRFGAFAWAASAEYRFPLFFVDRGAGPFPLFLDRVHGAVFFDAANAWGPTLGEPGFDNPRGRPLTSAGAELSASVLPFYSAKATIRIGWAAAFAGGGSRFYARFGDAF